MQAFKSRYLVLPVVAAFGLASGLALAQTKPAESAKPAAAMTADTGKAGSASTVRDWSKVDANGDDSVSAVEMEAYLKAYPGPLAKK